MKKVNNINLMNVNDVKELLGIKSDEVQTWQELKDVIQRNQKPNLAMLVDFYELTMSQTFFDTGDKDVETYFDIFFRTNPLESGYSISGGLDEIIDFIRDFHFNEADIDYLRSTNYFSEKFLNYLSNLKFNGDVWAIPDGTPVFPNEPVVTIKAKIIEAQLLETIMLAYFNHGSLIATAAKRITSVVPAVNVNDMGARRGHGESVTQGSKYAAIGGCSATSNVLAAMTYGLKPTGTMAHSIIEFYGNDYDAFLAYAKSNPTNCIFLIDTYDTLKKGLPAAIQVAKDYLVPNSYPFIGVRIDSGDLAYYSKEARKMLDEAGFYNTKIILTNGLKEDTIASLKDQGAAVEALGVGDNIIAPKERMNGVYKLVAINHEGKIVPRIKLSSDEIKMTNPGYKKVYRFYDNKTGYALGDVVALADEVIPNNVYTLISPKEEWKTKTINNYTVRELQVPIFKDGKLVYNKPTAIESTKYCKEQFKTLYPEIKRALNPHEYYVDLSAGLLNLKKNLIKQYRYEQPKIYKKGAYHE